MGMDNINMKKVLILLSTYNGEKYLPELIKSLLNQKGIYLNILIRDDGSRDGTVAYLKEIKDNRVEYYIGENKRAVGSFLELIQKVPSEYDYYAFCDQDDVWQEDKVVTAVNKLSGFAPEKPSLYYSGQIITDGELNVLYHHRLAVNRSIKANCIFNQLAGCTAVFNQALLMKMKEYVPEHIYGHDVWCYRVCAALKGNIIVESEGKILYRQHGDNVVGLKSGIKGKLHNMKDYIFKYNASSYARELLKGYDGQLDDEWRAFLQRLTQANHSFRSRFRLLTDKGIRFHSAALRITYIVKVILRKM